MPGPLTHGKPSVTAIIAAHNEADVIRAVVADLIGQGVQVYLLDHASTDGTGDAVREFLGRGLLRIEKFPEDAGYPSELAGRFAWSSILRRKTEIADLLDADWYIHHDADEFRESPWEEITLPEAIGRVDRLGYNAIDFEVLNFHPTDADRFEPGTDVRQALRFYEPVSVWDKRQIKCWKRQPGGAVDLSTSGGHEAEFEGRLVFPLRFVVRHYPIRGQAHGERKVFQERMARFVPEERADGWHVQYDAFPHGARFTRDASTLRRYDAEHVRLDLVLRHRRVEEIEQASAREIERMRDLTSQLAQHVESLRAALDRADDELARFRVMLLELRQELEADRAELRARDAAIASRDALNEGLQTALDAMRRSTSWRLTHPLRWLSRLLRLR
jgi:glycosyltransferase involved in cell wall biosynthesis